MSRLLGITLKESFARRGLTTIAEAWVPGVEKTEQALGVFELLEASGEMHVRVGFHPNVGCTSVGRPGPTLMLTMHPQTLQTPRPPEVVEILKAKGYTQTVPGAPMFSPSAPSNGHLLAVSGIKMVGRQLPRLALTLSSANASPSSFPTPQAKAKPPSSPNPTKPPPKAT